MGKCFSMNTKLLKFLFLFIYCGLFWRGSRWFQVGKDKAKFQDTLTNMTSLEKYEMWRDICVRYKGFGQMVGVLNVQAEAW